MTQADLDWHNPQVRQELHQVVNFWRQKGVKGFRFDVLNVIGKSEELVDSQAPGSSQEKSLYTDTPIVHTWIRELNQATFGQDQEIVTVGEMSSTTIENGISYTNPKDQELSMIFSFHHLKVDYENGEKWSNPAFDFLELKRILDEWQTGMSDGQGWNALFFNNHDQPRSNSRFGDIVNYPYQTQTLLATVTHLLRGTPYIYQGEEIGMTNPGYQELAQYNDVETHNNYRIMREKGYSHEKAMTIIQTKSRDNSRTPMQWDGTAHAGFTKATPWLEVAANYPTINVEKELAEGKIYAYYQELIRLRKDYDVISDGTYSGLFLDHPSIMGFVREYEGQQLLVLGHFYDGNVEIELPQAFRGRTATKLIGNGPVQYAEGMTLGPYEAVAFLFEAE